MTTPCDLCPCVPFFIEDQSARTVNSHSARWPSKATLRALQMLASGVWRPFRKRWIIVGMGKAAQAVLEQHKIPHLKLQHPAARGLIRRKHVWYEHCARVLIHSRKISGEWRQL